MTTTRRPFLAATALLAVALTGCGGGGVTLGTDGGGRVTVGQDGGTRQGTFGTTCQVTLGGAVRLQGLVSGTCDVNGDQRTITARTADGHSVVVDTNGPGGPSSSSPSSSSSAVTRASE